MVDLTLRVLGCLVLIIWFLLSFLAQFNQSMALNLLFRFSLLPQWKFFAPIPLMQNFYLLYRTAENNEEVSVWRELSPGEPREWYNFAWNPDRRLRKALFDLIASLAKNIKENPDNIMLSVPYLAILNVVSNLDHEKDTKYVQFCILEKSICPSDDDARLIIMSSLHGV